MPGSLREENGRKASSECCDRTGHSSSMLAIIRHGTERTWLHSAARCSPVPSRLLYRTTSKYLRQRLPLFKHCCTRQCNRFHHRQHTLKVLQSATYLTLCKKHMLKTMSIRVNKVESRRNVRQLTLTSLLPVLAPSVTALEKLLHDRETELCWLDMVINILQKSPAVYVQAHVIMLSVLT